MANEPHGAGGSAPVRSDPVRNAAAVTTHDTNELASVTTGLYVGGAGNVTVVMAGGTSGVAFVGVPTGTILPLQVKIVMATGTDATNIVALW
jgi:hypothetical protein